MKRGSSPDVADLPTEQFPLWLTAKLAAEYVGCKSVRAFYTWRWRHGVVPRSNNTVSRRDLDRVLAARRRTKWRVHPNSLANLRYVAAQRTVADHHQGQDDRLQTEQPVHDSSSNSTPSGSTPITRA